MAKAKKKNAKREIATSSPGQLAVSGLVDELRELIHQTRGNVAQSVNSALVQLYWRIGTRIIELLRLSPAYTSRLRLRERLGQLWSSTARME